MTATSLVLVLLPIYIVYGFVSSANHLTRVNLGCFIGIFITGITMVIMRNIPNNQLTNIITDWFLESDNWFTQNIAVSANTLWALIYFSFFILILIMVRILLHYVLLGKNPAYKEPHYLSKLNFNRAIFLILNISVLIFLVSHFSPVIGFDDGLLTKMFSWVREHIR